MLDISTGKKLVVLVPFFQISICLNPVMKVNCFRQLAAPLNCTRGKSRSTGALIAQYRVYMHIHLLPCLCFCTDARTPLPALQKHEAAGEKKINSIIIYAQGWPFHTQLLSSSQNSTLLVGDPGFNWHPAAMKSLCQLNGLRWVQQKASEETLVTSYIRNVSEVAFSTT